MQGREFHYSHVGKKKRLAFEAVAAEQLEEDGVQEIFVAVC